MALHKTWPSFDFLGRTLANESLNATNHIFKTKKFSVKVEPYEGGVYLKVLCEYGLLHSVRRGHVVYIFDLKRVAGYIGYAKSRYYTFDSDSIDAATKQMISNKTSIN
jgi:hypothetical protein